MLSGGHMRPLDTNGMPEMHARELPLGEVFGQGVRWAHAQHADSLRTSGGHHYCLSDLIGLCFGTMSAISTSYACNADCLASYVLRSTHSHSFSCWHMPMTDKVTREV